jgi:tetratricopeptide (TPR) repeat protein
LQPGQESELARFLGELEDVAPDWFMTWAAVGNVAQQRGRLSDAVEAHERALELNPEYSGSALALAVVLHTLGFVERAESILDDAAEHGSTPQLQLQRASLQSARALDDGDLERAIRIYDDALRTVAGRHGSHHSELALLEIRAGHAQRAERRVRTALGISEHEYSASLGVDLVLDHLALVYALVAQQKHDEADRLGADLRRYLLQLSDHGFDLNLLPLAEAFLDEVTGHPGRLEQGLRESIQLGFRYAPSMLRWVLPLPPDSPELSNLVAIMEAVVAPERERYVAAQAAKAKS